MTILLYDELCLEHDTGRHPESAGRLCAVETSLRKSGRWDRCAHPPARDASAEELALVHDPHYIEYVRDICRDGGGMLDADTVLSSESFRAAMRAAGLCIRGSEMIAAGEADNGFALIRPPGHHALPERGMGFCIFNNVAVAARHLQRRYGIERVLIIDWDVHHGNGTQDAFYEDGTVMYVSLHAWPFYPGTGSREERGSGRGAGYTLNAPLSPGVGGERYLEIFNATLEEARGIFKPDFIIISAGFDAVDGDPLGPLALKPTHYAAMTEMVCELACESCGGRLLSVLEGGYEFSLLSECVEAHLEVLLQKSEKAAGSGAASESPAIEGDATS